MLQNALHIGFYALLVISWQNTLGARQSRNRAIMITATAIMLGVILECLQLWIPGRYGSILDVGLNTAGAVGGAAINILLVSRRDSV